eukprot:SAG11_NODE_18587_length_486_cov_3.937984_2_plen_63_part_01
MVPGEAARIQAFPVGQKRQANGEVKKTTTNKKKKTNGVDFSKFAGKKDTDGKQFCYAYNAGKD